MKLARDLWRRGALTQKLAEIEPIDRVTAYVVAGLLLSFVLSYSALIRHGLTG
jgi:hypothetical protein